MKFFYSIIFTALACYSFGQTHYPPRPDRMHSFFGVHFDFHADESCNDIGRRVDKEMVTYVLDQIKPDYIQIDCKGHPGYSSYPTKTGNPAPGFTKDPLKIWREVTASKGIALYMHYSGVYDMRAIQLHPSWAAINADGKPSTQYTSVFSPYVDSLMIPQFKELSSVYGVDGIWVDGDCWAHQVDYSAAAKKLFTKKTGIKEIPLKPVDHYWNDYLNFTRDGFREYLNHYTNELHKYNPKFQIASNWAYSTFMPEAVNAPIDFISGDFSATNSMNSARFEGRFIRNQGKPWDLMAWGFSWLWNQSGTMSVKTPLQIERELATVLALGGGVQVYMRQQRDGSVYRWTIPVLAEVSKFVRARQPWCQYTEPVPQIGLILPTEILYARTNKPFSAYDNHLAPLHGVLENLLASQHVVDILAEHQLSEIDKYPLLIYPEWDSITPVFKAKLLKYVSSGGKLILIGPKTAALFKDELKITLIGKPEIKTNSIELNNILADIHSLSQEVKPASGTDVYGKYYYSWDTDKQSQTSATITDYGRGKIAAVYMNMGEIYLNRYVPLMRDFLDSLIVKIYPEPVVEVKGSHLVDVTLNKLDNKLLINIINASGPHDNESKLVFDEIPLVRNLTVNVRYPAKPNKVVLQPSNKNITYTYANKMVQFKLEELKIHEIIVIE